MPVPSSNASMAAASWRPALGRVPAGQVDQAGRPEGVAVDDRHEALAARSASAARARRCASPGRRSRGGQCEPGRGPGDHAGRPAGPPELEQVGVHLGVTARCRPAARRARRAGSRPGSRPRWSCSRRNTAIASRRLDAAPSMSPATRCTAPSAKLAWPSPTVDPGEGEVAAGVERPVARLTVAAVAAGRARWRSRCAPAVRGRRAALERQRLLGVAVGASRCPAPSWRTPRPTPSAEARRGGSLVAGGVERRQTAAPTRRTPAWTRTSSRTGRRRSRAPAPGRRRAPSRSRPGWRRPRPARPPRSRRSSGRPELDTVGQRLHPLRVASRSAASRSPRASRRSPA